MNQSISQNMTNYGPNMKANNGPKIGLGSSNKANKGQYIGPRDGQI